MSFDDSPVDQGLSSKFYQLLISIMTSVDNNLGGHYFKSDSDIVKITLILDCNSPNIEGTIPNELQGKNKFQAIYSFNLAKLVSFNFAISVFKEEMNRILNLLFFSLRFNPKTIDKIISDLDELYVNYGIQNESNLQ